VPETHLLRSIDRFVELDGLRQELAPFYSEKGRSSIDPELLIRMLVVGYCFGIRSERRARELAAHATTPALKEHLHEVARQYDGLAERADEPARTGARSP
jgi:hypothetical protein